MLTWDQLRADLARALERRHPGRAEAILQKIERRHRFDPKLVLDDTEPQLPALLELADAVRDCFPDRGDEMLAKLRRVLEDDDDRGHVTMRREEFLTRASDDRALGLPRLTIVRGPGIGEGVWIDRPLLVIGRSPNADLFLADPTASRRHAEVRVQRGTVFVSDQRSLNGTAVNRVTLEPLTDAPLANGDRVRCGSVVLAFTDPRPGRVA